MDPEDIQVIYCVGIDLNNNVDEFGITSEDVFSDTIIVESYDVYVKLMSNKELMDTSGYYNKLEYSFPCSPDILYIIVTL